MKILHLNTYDSGGSARAAYNFHLSLKADGFESKILVLKNKELTDKDVIQIKLNFTYKIKHYFNEIIRTIKKRSINKNYNFFNVDESIGFDTKLFFKNLPFIPDIIIIHWVSGFVNAKNLCELNKHTKAPIIWRFNDMNAFTGGCHYNNGCLNYESGCGSCPALKNNSSNDLSFKNYKSKIDWLSKTDITFVSSTTQIDEELKRSQIATVCKTKRILLSSASYFFKPTERELSLKYLGLPTNKKIIFFGAQYIYDIRKGFIEFKKAMEILKTKLTQNEISNILLVYASRDKINTAEMPFETIRLPFLNGNEELAKAYQCATIFASPSIEDAGPMMIVESILCGTPVVAFNIGLAKDAIENNISGFKVNNMDISEYANSIKKILDMPQNEYADLRKQCYNFAIKKFDLKREISEYKIIFEALKTNNNV